MQYKFSVFKELLKTKDTPYEADLVKIYDRLVKGKSKNIVDLIRAAKTKEEAERLKKTLPCILFAGIFSQRNSNSCIKHSGLMVLDFDKYETEEIMLEQRKLIEQNQHVILLFTSPSGNGLKVVVRIPEATKETHPKYYKKFYLK